MAAKGIGKRPCREANSEQKPGMTRQMSPSDQGNESDEDSLGQDEMDPANEDVEGGDLGQRRGCPAWKRQRTPPRRTVIAAPIMDGGKPRVCRHLHVFSGRPSFQMSA